MSFLRLNIIDKLLLITILSYSSIIMSQSYSEHKYPGCLANSTCSAQTGKKHLKWNRLIRSNKLVTRNTAISSGVFPLDIWSINPTTNDLQSWSSTCFSHNKKNIFQSKIFLTKKTTLNNFKDYDPAKPFYFTDQIVRFNQGKISTFIAPKEESPTSIRSNRVIFTLAENEIIYNLAITSKRQVKIVSSAKEYHQTYSIECPPHFKDYKGMLPATFPLQLSNYCRSIWNTDKKDYETILIQSFCP